MMTAANQQQQQSPRDALSSSVVSGAVPTTGRVKEVVVDGRINKVLSMRTDSATMIESFAAISSFFDQNTIETRRALRQDLEYQNIVLAKSFLTEYEKIYQQIEEIHDSSVVLEAACQSLASKVSTADENMKLFMKKAAELNETRANYLRQSEDISGFLRKFQLSQEETDILHTARIDVSAQATRFFSALQRLQTAYADCKAMVENNNYSAGFELLDALGQHQDIAYRRLFEWVKAKCEGLSDESSNIQDIDFQLQNSIRYLRTLPMYYSQCQDLIVNSRRTQLVQKFVIALTQGSTSGQVFRAMDLHCHDAVRYVGDMLAWMHQTMVSEAEFLEGIFSDNTSTTSAKLQKKLTLESFSLETGEEGEGGGTSEEDSSLSSSNKAKQMLGLSVNEMLVRSLQGLGRPLRSRIMQTLESRSSVLVSSGSLETLYHLTDLLSFYATTFNKLLPLENSVHSTVKGSLLECKRAFSSILSKQAELLLQSTAPTMIDLGPSQVSRDICRQIREIFKVYLSAMSPLPSDEKDDCYIDNVMGLIVHPLLQGCRVVAQHLNSADMAIYMLNNVALLKNEVAEGVNKVSVSSPDKKKLSQWLELLSTETGAWLQVIVAEETGKLLHRSDMDKLLELIEVLPSGLVASDQVGLDQDRVGTVLRSFYSSLLSSTSSSLFERLGDIQQREQARHLTAVAVANAHDKVYQMVAQESHQYDRNVLIHSNDEVRVMLQIE